MKAFVLPALLFMIMSTVAVADPTFVLSTMPRSQTLKDWTATYKVDLNVVVGFTATVALSVSAPTLPSTSLTITPQNINYPYTDKITVNVVLNDPKVSGVYDIVIQAKNGPALARDTVRVIIEARTHPLWKVFKSDNSPVINGHIDTRVAEGPTNFVLDRKKGIGWYARYDSLYKFDGTAWSAVAWPSQFMSTHDGVSPLAMALPQRIPMALDSTGGIYARGRFAIAYYKEGTWKVYTEDSSTGLTAALIGAFMEASGAYIRMEADGKGNLWIRTSISGLGRFDGERWWLYTKANSEIPSNFVYSMIVDRNSELWIRTNASCLSKFDGVYWTNYYGCKDLGPANAGGHPIGVDFQNNMWLSGAAISTYNGATSAYYGEDTMMRNVLSVAFDRNEQTWIGHVALSQYNLKDIGGLYRTDWAGRWHYTVANSVLPSSSITHIQADDNGIIWMITDDGSLVLCDGNAPPEDLFNSTTPVPETADNASRGLCIESRPNPTTGRSTISVTLPSAGRARVTIIDALGTERMTLLDESLESGRRDMEFDAAGLANGIYYVRVWQQGATKTHPIIVAH